MSQAERGNPFNAALYVSSGPSDLLACADAPEAEAVSIPWISSIRELRIWVWRKRRTVVETETRATNSENLRTRNKDP